MYRLHDIAYWDVEFTCRRVDGHGGSGQDGGILNDDRRCWMCVVSVSGLLVTIQRRRAVVVANVLH